MSSIRYGGYYIRDLLHEERKSEFLGNMCGDLNLADFQLCDTRKRVRTDQVLARQQNLRTDGYIIRMQEVASEDQCIHGGILDKIHNMSGHLSCCETTWIFYHCMDPARWYDHRVPSFKLDFEDFVAHIAKPRMVLYVCP